MPGTNKKWNSSAERDLAIAIIFSQQGDKVKYDWQGVHEVLANLGYVFTKDAISQHWTKSIMRDFKSRHGNVSGKPTNSAPSSPQPDSARKTPLSKSSKKRDRSIKDESDDGMEHTPSQKRKLHAIASAPNGGPVARQKSTTLRANTAEEDSA